MNEHGESYQLQANGRQRDDSCLVCIRFKTSQIQLCPCSYTQKRSCHRETTHVHHLQFPQLSMMLFYQSRNVNCWVLTGECRVTLDHTGHIFSNMLGLFWCLWSFSVIQVIVYLEMLKVDGLKDWNVYVQKSLWPTVSPPCWLFSKLSPKKQLPSGQWKLVKSQTTDGDYVLWFEQNTWTHNVSIHYARWVMISLW